MSRAKLTEKLTANNKEYKLAHRQLKLYCAYCRPHIGCNLRRYNKRVNWKYLRKQQYIIKENA